MELSQELSIEPLPASHHNSLTSLLSEPQLQTITNQHDGSIDKEKEIADKVETLLLERIKSGQKVAIFQLGQFYFEQEQFSKAKTYFERASNNSDFQAIFQLAVILFDGLAGKSDHKRGFELMERVAENTKKKYQHLIRPAQYNIGRAYYQGYGVRRSDEDAERYWLMAADDGNPSSSVKAQSTLGMFYCRSEAKELDKGFFWHSEACGNGSVESQGALGVMYLYGLGCKQDTDAAFICFREAAERGNVYAMGNLVAYYYKRKLHNKTAQLAARVALLDDPHQISEETDCLPSYICKGISMACFYYGRCLQQGLGISRDIEAAKKFYSKSYTFDPDACANLQHITQRGLI